jgi:hypothetical protein
MVFQDVLRGRKGKGKKEVSNRFRLKPTTSFRTDGEIIGYLYKLKTEGERSAFINQAIHFYIFYKERHKRFALNAVQENFSLYKHLVRQLGRIRKKSFA